MTTPSAPSTPQPTGAGPIKPGDLSPDQRWRWDGTAWQPLYAQAPPPPTPQQPKKKGHGRLKAIGIVALICLVGIIFLATRGGSSPSPSQSPAPGKSAAPAQASCPQPCAVAGDVTLTVSSVTYGADPGQFLQAEQGNVFVTMNVDAINKGDSEANLNPFNFVLQDAKGIKHTVTWTESCSSFSPINLTKGADSGAKCVAFEAAANAPAPLTLVWTPNFFGGDKNIKLA